MAGLFRPGLGPLFDGSSFEPPADEVRLSGQLARVAKAMRDGRWHTLDELVRQCGGTTASVSARLRDLRKARFGTHTIARQRVAGKPGLFQYRMTQ